MCVYMYPAGVGRHGAAHREPHAAHQVVHPLCIRSLAHLAESTHPLIILLTERCLTLLGVNCVLSLVRKYNTH